MSRSLPAAATDNPAAPELRPTATPSPRIEVSQPPVAAVPPTSAAPPAVEIDNDRWLDLVANSGLRGPARELAAHAAFVGYAQGTMRLSLSPDDDHLRAPGLIKALADTLSTQLGGPVQLKFETGKPADTETLHQRAERQRDAKQTAAEAHFMTHPDVQRLMSQQGAKLVPDSIRPYED
jgi:DNA polymerase-3 subunit gamma/tau